MGTSLHGLIDNQRESSQGLSFLLAYSTWIIMRGVMMKIKYKKTLKFSHDLKVGDNIRIGGLMCTIRKGETVFHHRPDARIRLELTVNGAAPRKTNIVLFLQPGLPINTLK
jgi:hypothetical protein